MKKTNEIVRFVLGTSYDFSDRLVPVKQIHLWLHVNFWRSRENKPPLNRLYFSRILYEMRAKGLIGRTYWCEPCDGNMWELVVKPNVRGNRPAEAGSVSLARDSGEAAARQAYAACRSGSG